MAISMPKDTRAVLGTDAKNCESRSLLFDRFANPSARDSGHQAPRKFWFEQVINRKPCTAKLDSWARWLGELGLKTEDVLIFQLQSRLMVNMAGGVMENAGLCLDRFGMPYIPGSAIKGCARRTAIQELLEARAKASDDELAKLLSDIALVFGWSQEDWISDSNKQGSIRSDFVYSVGRETWHQVSTAAGCLLLGAEPKRAKDFGSFAGCISFLPAYPCPREPPIKDLELDVITCHHSEYYGEPAVPSGVPHSELRWRKWKREHDEWEANRGTAPDIEEPKPVLFPAVAVGAAFQFAVLPLRGERKSLSRPETRLYALARDWLRCGLETFGLGGKTAAGYGWFKEIGSREKPAAKPQTS
jgi:CRISPR-associated protein Cmr6